MTIKEVFQTREQPLISYVMVGDGGFEKSLAYAKFLIESGADILELGMPFSDPAADGETILKAGIRAQEAHTTMRDVIRFAKCLKKEYETPLVIMSYLNPIYQYGYELFFSDISKVGVEACIIPDLPFEGIGEVEAYTKANHIKVITMLALNTPEDRVKKLTQDAEGFLYLVAVKGITGTQSIDPKALMPMTEIIRKYTKVPIAAGFGIKTSQDRLALRGIVDGVVIASAFIALKEEGALEKIKEIIDMS